MSQSKEYRKMLRERRKANGLCAYCANHSIPGRICCEACTEKRQARNGQPEQLARLRILNRRRRERAKASGICQDCRNPRFEGRTLCWDCLEKRRKRSCSVHRARAAKKRDERALLEYRIVAFTLKPSPPVLEFVDRMLSFASKMPPVRLTAEDIYRRRPQEWA